MEKDQVTLICLHGFMGCPEDWSFLEAQLDCSLYCPPIPLLPFEKACEAVIDNVSKIEGTKYLMGYSMGGRVGMGMLSQCPSLFKKAFILSAHPGLKTQVEKEGREIWDKKQIQLIQQMGLKEYLDLWYDMPLFGGIKKHHQYQQMLARRLKSDPQHLIKQIEFLSVAKQPNYWELPVQFSGEIHFLAGSQDKKYLELGQSWAHMHPQLKLQVIENCSHQLPLEANQELIKYLQLNTP